MDDVLNALIASGFIKAYEVDGIIYFSTDWSIVKAVDARTGRLLWSYDPRASQASGDPIITMVAEVVQSKRVSEAIAPCAMQTGNAQLSCMADALEKPYSTYQPFPFPEKKVATAALIKVG